MQHYYHIIHIIIIHLPNFDVHIQYVMLRINYAERSEVWLGRLPWKRYEKLIFDISKYTVPDCFQNLRGYRSWVKEAAYTFWWWSDLPRSFYNFFNAYRSKFKFFRFKPNFYVFWWILKEKLMPLISYWWWNFDRIFKKMLWFPKKPF